MSNEVEIIELNIEAAKGMVELGNCLERLSANPDFRKLIDERYLEKEAVRLVRLKSDPSMQRPEVQAAIIRDIDAIGSFHQFLINIERGAQQAADAIVDNEEALDQIRAEEAGE